MIKRIIIFENVKEILKPWTDGQRVTEKTNLTAGLGMDSVAILQMILALEEKFSIKIPNHLLELQTFSSVSNLMDLVERCTDETC
jgi:acyl carrier protein